MYLSLTRPTDQVTSLILDAARMRVSLTSLLSLVGLAALVRAGKETRGAELLAFFEGYRIDVEVNGADGAKLAKGCQPIEADFEDGVIPDGQRGCNLWGFMRRVGDPPFRPGEMIADPNVPDGENDPPRVRGFSLVADANSPTVQEVRNMYKWGPDPYSKILPKQMFPDDFEEKGRNNRYFDFHNMQALLGKRIDELSTEDMDKARPHMEKIDVCLEWAAEGRRKDTAKFKITAAKAVLESFKIQGKPYVGKTVRSNVARNHFGRWEEMDTDKTVANIKKTKLDRDLEKAKEAMRTFEKDYRNGNLRQYKNKGNPIGGGGSAVDHGNTADASAKLRAAVQKRLAGEACEWPEPNEPK